ncbi:hypothetical protein J4218_05625 [Candidatus Pacearchaeota archaeon]|nr:hypothetical protein [Candidatus Pacearchaeota archaeon]
MRKETIGKVQLILGILILIIGIYLFAVNYNLRYGQTLNIRDKLPSQDKNDLINQYVSAWNSFQSSESFNNSSNDIKTILKVDFANTLFTSMESYYAQITVLVYFGVIIFCIGLMTILQGLANMNKDIKKEIMNEIKLNNKKVVKK